MKKPRTTKITSTPDVNTATPIAAEVPVNSISELKSKKATPARKTSKKIPDVAETPAPEIEIEQPVDQASEIITATPEENTATLLAPEVPVISVAEPKPKKATPARKTSKKVPDVVETPTPEIEIEQSVVPAPVAKTRKKAQIKSTTPEEPGVEQAVVVTDERSSYERVGLAAGAIWHYLNDHGATAVSKLVKALPEEESIIQRGIGWLAKEDKIALDIIKKVETIWLKG